MCCHEAPRPLPRFFLEPGAHGRTHRRKLVWFSAAEGPAKEQEKEKDKSRCIDRRRCIDRQDSVSEEVQCPGNVFEPFAKLNPKKRGYTWHGVGDGDATAEAACQCYDKLNLNKPGLLLGVPEGEANKYY